MFERHSRQVIALTFVKCGKIIFVAFINLLYCLTKIKQLNDVFHYFYTDYYLGQYLKEFYKDKTFLI